MEVETTPPEPSPKKIPAPSPRRPLHGNTASPKSPSGGGAVGGVSERLELYKQAVQQAEAAGEGSKVRRYKRSITTLEQVCVEGWSCTGLGRGTGRAHKTLPGHHIERVMKPPD